MRIIIRTYLKEDIITEELHGEEAREFYLTPYFQEILVREDFVRELLDNNWISTVERIYKKDLTVEYIIIW
ncbi:MAG: hypothetical protein ACP5H7_02640 [Minisyncoccia bacterium]